MKVEVYVENGEPEVAAVEPEPSLTPEQAAGAFSNFRISEATVAKLKGENHDSYVIDTCVDSAPNSW